MSTRCRQAGLSLIELMISITIGMVIALAATSAYLGASTAGNMAEAQGRMNEDGQMALNVLTQQLRMAGANPAQGNRDPSSVHNPLKNPYSVRGCDLAFTSLVGATSTSSLVCSHAASSTGPDAIAINYEADAYNTSTSTAGGTPTDCMGGAITPTTASVTTTGGVTATVQVYEVLNTYYIGTSSAVTAPSLYCKGIASTATPLVENIESVQFTYGMSAPTNTATVAGYLDAYDVEHDSNLNTAVDPSGGTAGSQLARWNSVKVVRICVIVRTANPILSDAGSAKYYNCDGNLVAASTLDYRLRRAFTTTVVLRNQ